jgi:hypothetical protein
MSKKDTRSDNREVRELCQWRLDSSPLPDAIKSTLRLIIRHMGSPSDYTLAWVSHATLAKTQHKSERTIEWHCNAIEESGILEVQKLGLREARKRLNQEFGYALKGTFAHRLTFYRINRNHSFWAGDDQAVSTIKEVLARRGGGDHKPGRPRYRSKALNPVARDTAHDALNPVAGDALNPVAGDALNPVAGDGKRKGKEEAVRAISDETPRTASSDTLDSLEERTLPEERDSTSWKSRGRLTQLSGEDLRLPDLIRSEKISQIIAEAECRLLADNFNRFQPTSSDWTKTAAQVESLFHQLRRNQGRYPTPEEVVDALNSESFRGLRQHSWGLLCAKTPDLEGNYICRIDFLEYEIIKQMSASDAAQGVNPIRRNHQLESLQEMKRHNTDDPELDELIREVQAESEGQNKNAGAES